MLKYNKIKSGLLIILFLITSGTITVQGADRSSKLLKNNSVKKTVKTGILSFVFCNNNILVKIDKRSPRFNFQKLNNKSYSNCFSNSSNFEKKNFKINKEEFTSKLSVDKAIKTTSVVMGEGKYIQMLPGEKKKKRSIFSFDFEGCTGVLVYVLLENGEQRAILTHYPPKDKKEHVLKVRNLCNQLKNKTDKNKIVKVIATIFHLVSWKKDDKTGFCAIKAPQNDKLVDMLITAIRDSFIEQVKVFKELYSGIEANQLPCQPHGMHGDVAVPKELEIVLNSDQERSYFQTQASFHKKNRFLDL